MLIDALVVAHYTCAIERSWPWRSIPVCPWRATGAALAVTSIRGAAHPRCLKDSIGRQGTIGTTAEDECRRPTLPIDAAPGRTADGFARSGDPWSRSVRVRSPRGMAGRSATDPRIHRTCLRSSTTGLCMRLAIAQSHLGCSDRNPKRVQDECLVRRVVMTLDRYWEAMSSTTTSEPTT